MSVNTVILVGKLGRDPELKHTQSGIPYCRLSLATNTHWTDQSGQNQEKTEWHRITVWKKRAENVTRYSCKGSQIYVQGRLETRSWDHNGQKRYETDVVAEDVKVLSRRRDAEESPPTENLSRSGRGLNIASDFGDGNLGDLPY